MNPLTMREYEEWERVNEIAIRMEDLCRLLLRLKICSLKTCGHFLDRADAFAERYSRVHPSS